jgi:hypothetical protein
MLNALLDRFGLEPPERPTLVRWTLKLVGVWVVVLTTSWFLLQWYSRRGDVISVPDVRGMEREAAVEALEEAGLEPMQLDSVYKDGAEPHHVADQVPPPGSQIKGGRLVYLTTYRALPPSESIGVKEGQDLAVARIILQNKGFRITEVAEPHTTLLNKVIRITDARGRTVSSGSRYPRGASLTVVYGSADGGRVPVPALLGLSYSAARDGLRQREATQQICASRVLTCLRARGAKCLPAPRWTLNSDFRRSGQEQTTNERERRTSHGEGPFLACRGVGVHSVRRVGSTVHGARRSGIRSVGRASSCRDTAHGSPGCRPRRRLVAALF